MESAFHLRERESLGSAIFAWMVRRFDRLDAKIDRLDEKFSGKIDNLTVAVSQLEGAVYHGNATAV